VRGNENMFILMVQKEGSMVRYRDLQTGKILCASMIFIRGNG
jgi:hypothetical protein